MDQGGAMAGVVVSAARRGEQRRRARGRRCLANMVL
jgi:hypothetical protein